jgi:hypothetical protein
MNRKPVLATVALVLLVGLAIPAQAEPPLPEPNFAGTIAPPEPCAPQPGNPYEERFYRNEGWKGPEYVRYPGACQRLRFAYGPIHVKPGQNDVLIEPVTIQKPNMDGYIVRFKPDLVRLDGSVPPIEEIHLHHGTWVNFTDDYGDGQPFFASGEEKTYAPIPRGYGMPVSATDDWFLLYMVHNQLTSPDEVFITYDVDFIAKDAAEAPPIGLKSAYPIWLDVRPSFYPVFNVQRGFGNGRVCTWPKQNCARFDPWGDVFAGQGKPSNKPGTDWSFPARGESLGGIEAFYGGTLIGLGGHLHPGGINDQIDLVRNGKAKRILTSEAVYWDWKNPSRGGGPPTSWDMSMTVNGLPYWGVRVRPGDKLRINATYDAKYQSTYENMGIAIGYVVPDRLKGGDAVAQAPGVDPFAPGVKTDNRTSCPSGGLQARRPTLCTRGFVTHGHLPESDNHSGPNGKLTGAMSSHTDGVVMASFNYLPGDLATADQLGIPTVTPGSEVRFFNADAFINVYHSATSCAYPCLGSTGIAFPIADGRSDKGDLVDFDSGQLGFGIPEIGPAKQTAYWTLPIGPEFESGHVYTYFCRVHPFMRGAFAVE